MRVWRDDETDRLDMIQPFQVGIALGFRCHRYVTDHDPIGRARADLDLVNANHLRMTAFRTLELSVHVLLVKRS